MTYQVLARKWRPRTFEQMAGQDHVRRALANGLAAGRIHHAYLFTGTRGVGKTTAARILAKCLNCERDGVTATPCGECDACREIDEGRFVDLIEVDAASRTKVEDTRELLDNVQYAPSRGRFKIYLVDEVHMLSGHSFNALLKTLEEPPDHVKFLLATTDPQKLPVTVLSRCLQFNLKHLPAGLIADHLRGVLAQEGIDAEAAAVDRIARAADGSVRDGLSLMDQALAFNGGGAVSEAAVREMLGTLEQDHVFALLEAAAAGDGRGVLDEVARMAEYACDFSEALAEILGLLHQIAVCQSVAGGLDEATPDRERIEALAQRLSPEECQLFYQIGINGRRDLGHAPEPRTGFEMTLLRMLAFRPAEVSDAGRDLVPGELAGGQSGSVAGAAGAPAEPDDPGAARGSSPAARSAPAAPPTAGDDTADSGAATDDWAAVVGGLELGGMARALAEHCFLRDWDGSTLRLGIDATHQHLLNASMQERLQQALRERHDPALTLSVQVVAEPADEETPAARQAREGARRQADAERAIDEDPQVAALRETFDARVARDSVRPRDDH